MDSISSNANPSASKIIRATERTVPKAKADAEPEALNSAKLLDFNGLAERVDSSGANVSMEAIERGKALISDPNWPNDSILDGLAKAILKEEDFDS